MKKGILILTVVSLIPSQIKPVTPAVAIAGTALVGTAAAANVYRVYKQPTSKEYNKYDYVWSHQTRLNWAIGLGIAATAGTAFALHQATPLVRLSRATQLLSSSQTNPLLRHHSIVRTAQFMPAVSQQYARAALPLAKAFKDLRESRKESTQAIGLIHKARKEIQTFNFGQHVVQEAEQTNVKFDDLMLAIKEQPDFSSQHTTREKIKSDKAVASSAQTIATAQTIQAINSFSHRR